MQLSNFISANMEGILAEWEKFAHKQTPAAANMDQADLRDHAKNILRFIIKDIESPQTSSEQNKKSQGKGLKSTKKDSAAETHATLRWEVGFNLPQMVSEYRALRASVISLWGKEQTQKTAEDYTDLVRFNEAIDQALTESTGRFVEEVNYSRDLFLGILGHDLRNPLGAISTSAEVLLAIKNDSSKQVVIATIIQKSAKRANQMINDLLDFTRGQLGGEFPITLASMDMKEIGQHIVKETQAFHPESTILFHTTGNLQGEWDSARIGQIFSNLLSNAIQHGSKKSPITVTVTGTSQNAIISVHNEGAPIPSNSINTIFNPLTRGAMKESSVEEASQNLGLGLYITKQIVVAHGGTINVNSSKKNGTIFSISLPKKK